MEACSGRVMVVVVVVVVVRKRKRKQLATSSLTLRAPPNQVSHGTDFLGPSRV